MQYRRLNIAAVPRYSFLLSQSLNFLSPTFHVQYPAVHVLRETSPDGAAGPAAVSAAPASIADAAGPRVFGDIPVAFVVSALASGVPEDGDSPGRPRFFLAFPNIDCSATSSSSAGVVGLGSVHSPTGAHANHGLCSILSSPGPRRNRTSGRRYNKPSPGHNNVSDTSDLPTGATTSRSRKTGLRLYRVQRTRRLYRAALPPPEAPQIRRVGAGQFRFQYLRLPLPLPGEE